MLNTLAIGSPAFSLSRGEMWYVGMPAHSVDFLNSNWVTLSKLGFGDVNCYPVGSQIKHWTRFTLGHWLIWVPMPRKRHNKATLVFTFPRSLTGVCHFIPSWLLYNMKSIKFPTLSSTAYSCTSSARMSALWRQFEKVERTGIINRWRRPTGSLLHKVQGSSRTFRSELP